MAATGFVPADHAFRFRNQFVNVVVNLPLVPPLTTKGRCGGMAFAALDYFHAGVPTPRFTAADFSGPVPPDGHGLADYIYRRQLDSMKPPDGPRFIVFSRMSDPALVRHTLDNEIPRIRASIDAGEPVVIGLIRSRRAAEVMRGGDHQAVCHGYVEDQDGRTTLRLYDPNWPPTTTFSGEVRLFAREHPDAGKELPGNPAEPIRTVTGVVYPAFGATHGGPWRGFFLQRYTPSPNPPRHFGPVGAAQRAGDPPVGQPPLHMR